MEAAPFFRDIALVFIAALVGGAFARWLHQPLFVGYIIGGLLISPFTPGPAVQDIATFQTFAQIGVIFLMFSIGIELSLHELARAGLPAMIGAPAVIALTTLVMVGAGRGLGLSWEAGAAVGIVISVSSTMVVAKLLVERGEINTPHARLTLGTTLMEDLITVALIVVLPVLATGEAGRFASIVIALGRAALVLVPFFYLANRVVPRIMARVARRGDTELFFLVIAAIAIVTAALFNSLGLSLALGAFLAGLVISESEFTHEALARTLPMRDIFGALFFVSVGTLIRPRDLAADLPVLLVVLAVILVGKFILRALVLRGFRYPWPTALLVSTHLAQAGEFSFVLALVARGLGLLPESTYQAILAATLLSIIVTSIVSEFAHRLIEEPAPAPAAPGQRWDGEGHVLICGFGRVGGTVGEALEAFDIPFVVVDLDYQVIEALRRRGVPAVYGDVASGPVLRQAGADRARLAVVTAPDFERTRLAVRSLRQMNPQLTILARSTQIGQRAALLEAGASEVIQPEFEAAQTLLRHGLERLGIPFAEVRAYMLQQRRLEFSPEPPGPEPALPASHLLQTSMLRIGPGFCRDVSLRRARIRERTGVTVLAVRRADGTEIVNPEADVVLRLGDEVTVTGLPEQIALFEHLNEETR